MNMNSEFGQNNYNNRGLETWRKRYQERVLRGTVACVRTEGRSTSEYNMAEAGLICYCSPESVPRELSHTELNP